MLGADSDILIANVNLARYTTVPQVLLLITVFKRVPKKLPFRHVQCSSSSISFVAAVEQEEL
jgi:hypothetical protein